MSYGVSMRCFVTLIVGAALAAETVAGLAACAAFVPLYLYLFWHNLPLSEGSPPPVLE